MTCCNMADYVPQNNLEELFFDYILRMAVHISTLFVIDYIQSRDCSRFHYRMLARALLLMPNNNFK